MILLTIAFRDSHSELIGRIMRVHGLLQGWKLPPLLENGYLFLADHESQGGVSEAAMKIKKLRSELGSVSPFNMLVNVGGRSGTQLVTNGQPQFFPTEEETDGGGDGKEERLPGVAVVPVTTSGETLDFLEILGVGSRGTKKGAHEIDEPTEEYVYLLKLGMPLRFMLQELPLEVDDLLACVEQQIKFDDAALLKSLAAQTEVIRVEKDLFGKLAEMRTTMLTRLDLEKAAERAQELLFKQSYLDPKGLLDHLLKRLAVELRNHGQHEVADDEERLEAALDLILINDPKLLREVQKSCAARFAVTREADLLPGRVESAVPLESSHKNIYGVFPADLNSWEKAFAKLLDADGSGRVLWWHRNPVKKRYSVCIVRSDGGRFFQISSWV